MIQANRKMMKRLENIKKPRNFDRHLSKLLRYGFAEKNGCLLLKYCAANGSRFSESGMDKTGYEAFINHEHVRSISQGWEYAKKLAARLKRRRGRFVVIVSFDGKGATVRFHKLRRNEPTWLAADLESYKEAVAVVYPNRHRS